MTWAFVVWVWVSASQKIPLSVLAQNPHLCARFPTRLEEGRKVPEENRDVNRTGQSAGKRRWLLGPVDSEAGLANVRGWVCTPDDFGGISIKNTLALAHRCTECLESITNFALGANPSQCLFVPFPSTLSVVCDMFCVSIKKCEIPLAGDERNHSMIWWPWVVEEVEILGTSQRCIVIIFQKGFSIQKCHI